MLTMLLLACFALLLLTCVIWVVYGHQFLIGKFSPDYSYSVFYFIKISVAQAGVKLPVLSHPPPSVSQEVGTLKSPVVFSVTLIDSIT